MKKRRILFLLRFGFLKRSKIEASSRCPDFVSSTFSLRRTSRLSNFISALFSFEARRRISFASSPLPLVRSQRADSGMNLKLQTRYEFLRITWIYFKESTIFGRHIFLNTRNYFLQKFRFDNYYLNIISENNISLSIWNKTKKISQWIIITTSNWRKANLAKWVPTEAFSNLW